MKGEQQHYKSLDGLRGLAAVSVVLWHYITVFAPFLIGYTVTTHHFPLSQTLATTPMFVAFSGNFDVCVFFVLSGFVLSAGFFNRGKDSAVVISSAVRRYFRLMIPAFVSIMAGYLLLRFGSIFYHQATLDSQTSAWLTQKWAFLPSFGQAILQGLYSVWFGTFDALKSYNSVLWTMHYELFGSFLVFMFLALFGKLRNRWILYGFLAIVFMKTYYLGFLLGVALSDVAINYPEVLRRFKPRLLWPVLIAGLVLGSWTTETIYTGWYMHLHVPTFSMAQLEVLWHITGGFLVVLAVLSLKPLSRLLESKPLQYIGKTSFALYLTHELVIISFGSFVFVHAMSHFGYRYALPITVLSSLSLTFVVAHFYTKLVDVPAISISRRIGNYLLVGDALGDISRVWQRLNRLVRRPIRSLAPPDSSDAELAAEESTA